MKEYSSVYLREEQKRISVPNGTGKPEISSDISGKWQQLLDLLSENLNVPASLIMKVTPESMQVFLSSQSDGNPYEAGASDTLGHGLYCETVIGRNQMLEVPNAPADDAWKDNPDVKLNMVSYLGYPLQWPDGSYFGTICSLDNGPRDYSSSFKELMQTFKQVVETDLGGNSRWTAYAGKNLLMDRSVREIHHRLKNNFTMIISYMQLQRNLGAESPENLLKDAENRIMAVSLLHEKLYKSVSLNPDALTYVRELINLTTSTLTDKSIESRIDIESFDFGKHLLNLGIVLVELITNSVKYAFEDVEKPMITITFTKSKDRVHFRYGDNGPGLVDKVSEGFGALVLDSFADQYQGSFEIEGPERNTFHFDFDASSFTS